MVGFSSLGLTKHTRSKAPTSAAAKLNAALLLAGAILSYSLPVYFFIPIKGNVLFLALAALFLLLNIRALKFPIPLLFILLGLPITASISAIYWQDMSLVLLPAYMIASLFILVSLNDKSLKLFVDWASVAVLVALIGAVVGFVLAALGVPAFIEFENPDGRPAYLFLGTVSNSVVGNFIRPSGFFDEPGTLSFVTSLVVALRYFLGKNGVMSFTMLALGLVTMSLAHVFFFLFYLLSARSVRIRWVFMLLVVFSLIIFAFPILIDAFSERFFSRFAILDGTLVGDSRTNLVKNALGYLSGDVFFWGVDPVCFVRGGMCTETYLPMGENPFTMISIYGIFLSWPYYGILIALLFRSLGKRGGIAFGILLLLLQRPYVIGFGYSLLISITVFSLYGFWGDRAFRRSSHLTGRPLNQFKVLVKR